jgi:D-3-phosphoglycerate dehydrogenase
MKNMNNILVIQPLHPDALAILDARDDITYTVVTDFSEENLLRHAAEADVITIRDAKLPTSIIEAAPRLKAISRHGVGYDNIPIEYCSARGIPVMLVGDANANAVAEQTLLLIMASARCLIMLDSSVRKGDFSIRSRLLGQELKDRKLLLVGFGRIGRRAGRLAAAVGMKVFVFDPYLRGEPDPWVTPISSLIDGLEQAEVLSLHIPLTPDTRHMIGAAELALLPKGAIVINVSRGGLIDESALLGAIRSGHLHGAGLDVFETEPLPADSPLLAEPRIVMSPHAAALTDSAMFAMSRITVENALAAIDKTINPKLTVNPEILAMAEGRQ